MACCSFSKAFLVRPAIWIVLTQAIFMMFVCSQYLYGMRESHGIDIDQQGEDQQGDVIWGPEEFPEDSGKTENTKKVPSDGEKDVADTDSKHISIQRGDIVVVLDCGDGYYDDYDVWVPDRADCETEEALDPAVHGGDEEDIEVDDAKVKGGPYRDWFICDLSFNLILLVVAGTAQYGYSQNKVQLYLPLITVLALKVPIDCYDVFTFVMLNDIIMAIYVVVSAPLDVLIFSLLVLMYKAMAPQQRTGSVWDLGDNVTVVSG